MRKRNGPLWVVLLLVGVAAGGAHAQSPEWEPAWWMGAPLRQFVATLPSNDGAAHEWLSQVLTGGEGLRTETCAFVAGMGSKPRLDGGGEGLAPFDPSWDPAAIDWDQLGGTWPQTDVVIVDVFDFEDLITALLPLTGQSFTANEAERWREAVASATVRPFVDPSSPPPYDVRHGHLVLHHVLALLGGHEIVVDAVDRTEVAAAGDLGRVALDLRVQDRAFTVHLEGIRFEDAATIHDAMQGFVERYGRETIAIASWGLVDCALSRNYADAAASDPDATTSLGDYLLQLIRSPESSVLLVQVCEAFESWLEQSPVWNHGEPRPTCDEPLALALALAMMEKQAAEDVGWPFAHEAADPDAQGPLPFGRVYASAGNQGLPFPMPPAAWPGVMGVAACDAPEELAWYSNVGDFIDAEHVRAPGGWFPLEVDGIEVGYWGTSFAAPHAALALGNGFQTPGPVGLHPCRDPAAYPTAP